MDGKTIPFNILFLMIYFFVLFVILICIYRYDIKHETYFKNNMFYIILFLLIFLSSFRYRVGLDTIRYMSLYPNIPTINNISLVNYFINRHEPFYYFLEVICKSFSSHFYLLQIIQSIIVNYLFFIFLKNHCKYLFTSIFLYYTLLYFTFNFEAMRSSIAVVIFLNSYTYLYNNNYLKFFIFSLIAFLFHNSAIILFILPFFKYIKVSKNIFSVLFLTYLITFLLTNYILNLNNNFIFLNFINSNSNSYLSNDYLQYRLNLFGVISNIIKYIIFPFFLLRRLSYNNYFQTYKFENNIFFVMFISILMLNFPFFERLLDYFLPFYIILIVDYLEFKIESININFRFKFYAFVYIFFIILFKIYGQFFSKLSNIYNYNRYFPYTSIFDKKVIKTREQMYNKSFIKLK
jgi:hypothetical protein